MATKHAFYLNQLEEDEPLLYHQYATDLMVSSFFRHTLPTQLVYPNTEMKVGLRVHDIQSLVMPVTHSTEVEDVETRISQGNLIVYASQTPKDLIWSQLWKLYLAIVIIVSLKITAFVAKSTDGFTWSSRTASIPSIAVYTSMILLYFYIPFAKLMHCMPIILLFHSILNVIYVPLVLVLCLNSFWDLGLAALSLLSSFVLRKIASFYVSHAFRVLVA